MELQIIKDKKNPLLKRREVSIKINNKGTPSRIDVKNKLAAIANSKPELIVIEHLDTVFGKTELAGIVNIYESEERLKQLAHQHIPARDVPAPKEGEVAAAPAPKEGEATAAPAHKEGETAAAPAHKAAKEPEKKGS